MTVEASPRKGDLLRIVERRDVTCRCECDRTFDNTGAAASHARSARHIVEVDYYTAFRFAPAERVPGAES